MSRGINKVILVGNLGKDPEVQYLENNTALARFSLATSDSYKNREGQKIDTVEWHNIILWKGLAEIAEKYLKKGSKIYLEGKLKTRSWEDKEGVKRYTTEVVGNQMVMLDSRGDGSGYSSAPPPKPEDMAAAANEPKEHIEDDLPF